MLKHVRINAMQVMTTLHVTVAITYEHDDGQRTHERHSGLIIPIPNVATDNDLIDAVCVEVRRALLE